MNNTTTKRIFSDEEIGALNDRYRKLSSEQRITELYKDFELDEIMLTSSFAATSALLLKLFSDINKKQLVYFIDTGFHFKETLIYKEYLTQLYDLNVENVQAENFKHEFTVKDETWKKDPNYCCTLNKVEPISALKETHTLWVSGLMSWQSDHRKSLDIFEQRNGILKFYPLLDLTRDERENFIHDHHLPFHPLISKGYLSIGCSHCTKPGKGRDGRWNNNPKTECGLHL
ncbi:MAG: phosphoadenylyl-sulfate reductase [Crocinitomicaceae bacterium]